MDGIELGIRFSYITNSLRYCGPEYTTKQIQDFFKGKGDKEDLKNSLRKFESLYIYLKAIADKYNKDVFDEKVVEAYWIGNELLDNFTKGEMQDIIRDLMKRGLPKSIGENLIEKMPEGAFPHHTFHVMFVGVGNVSGNVETNIDNMNNCRVGIGKVLDISHDLLIVQSKPLKHDDKFFLGENETFSAQFEKKMLLYIKIGDYVALHWGFACVILNEKQIENLQKYTEKVLEIIQK